MLTNLSRPSQTTTKLPTVIERPVPVVVDNATIVVGRGLEKWNLPPALRQLCVEYENYDRALARHLDDRQLPGRTLNWLPEHGAAVLTLNGPTGVSYDVLVNTLQMCVLLEVGQIPLGGTGLTMARLLAAIGCSVAALAEALMSLTAAKHPLLVLGFFCFFFAFFFCVFVVFVVLISCFSLL